MSRVRAGVAVVAVVLAAAGCGDPLLWARYRAEHDFWRARRLIERIESLCETPAALVSVGPARESLIRR